MALTISGCATASFAPPEISYKKTMNYDTNTSKLCSDRRKGQTSTDIGENFSGAMQVIDNFALGYRCAAREAAEGRAYFEVPAFLIGTTAVIGQTLGISEDATIGLAAATVAARQGNSYLAPQEKALLLNSALDAVNCIQLEAVGITGFGSSVIAEPSAESPVPSQTDKQAIDEIAKGAKLADDIKALTDNGKWQEAINRLLGSTEGKKAGNKAKLEEIKTRLENQAGDAENPPVAEILVVNGEGKVTVNAEQQYFRMVLGSLRQVETVLARRMSQAGNAFDTRGVLAELELLNIELAEAKKAADAADTPTAPVADAAIEALQKSNPPGSAAAVAILQAEKAKAERSQQVILKIKEVRPQLEKCILLAKL